jgi:GNAT superfamily N-acetyltransferase
MDRILLVRTSVIENHMSAERMAAHGITRQSVLEELAAGELGGFVAEEGGEVVAFAMARRSDGSIFALFTLPGREGRGYGSALLDRCLDWLRQCGHREAWLSTGRGTRAEAFYRKRGWREEGQSAEFPEDAIFRLSL